MTPQWQLDAELQDTIDNERLAGRRRPRCTARVNDYALDLRNRDSPTHQRCLRLAKVHRRCAQHATEHDRIVARILEIPPRD